MKVNVRRLPAEKSAASEYEERETRLHLNVGLYFTQKGKYLIHGSAMRMNLLTHISNKPFSCLQSSGD